MKKILLLIAAMGLIMGIVSCDDEPGKRGDGIFNVNTPMINHIVNQNNGNVLGMSSTFNKLTLDTIKHTASLELNYNDGNGDKTLKISDIKAMPKRLGFYELTSASNASFSGYVDFMEGAMRYCYTTAEGLRVISTIDEVFFLKTHNTISYLDTTKTTVMGNVMYMFTLMPTTTTATVKVMDIVHAKDFKRFISITSVNVPCTVTREGYTLSGENLATTALYKAWTDSTGYNPKTTDKYPFKTFSATVNLEKDSLFINFMMGDSAVVVASGTTYPDYTTY